jgi:hypothetical protein
MAINGTLPNIERVIGRGEGILAQQRIIVAVRRAGGHDVTEAKHLLDSYARIQTALIQLRDNLLHSATLARHDRTSRTSGAIAGRGTYGT